jgi:hypothetical protein
MGFIFFVLFALTLLAMYIGVRRQVAPIGLIAALGMVASIVMMTLYLLTLVDAEAQAILFGIVGGALFAGLTLGAAWYFHTHDPDAIDRHAES